MLHNYDRPVCINWKIDWSNLQTLDWGNEMEKQEGEGNGGSCNCGLSTERQTETPAGHCASLCQRHSSYPWYLFVCLLKLYVLPYS